MHQISFLKPIISDRKALILFLLCFFFLSACSSSKSVKRPSARALKLGDPILCKALTSEKDLTLPVELTREFTIEDKEVISHLNFFHLTGEHHIRWEWYDPKGNLFETTGNFPLNVGKGEYEGTLWHGLKLNAPQAAGHLGEWSVRIYMDDQLAAVSKFMLKRKTSDLEIARNDSGNYQAREKQSQTMPNVTMKKAEEREDGSPRYEWWESLIMAISIAVTGGKLGYGSDVDN